MSTRLWLAVLCGYFALGATIQALPAVLARGPGTLGLLVTLAAAATAVTRPFAGRFADRGRALGVARAGAALVAVGAAGHLVADTAGTVALARLTIGAGEGALFTGALAHVMAAAPVERRGRLIGHFGLSMWGGLAVGPPLAALAAAHTSPRGALWLAATAGAAAVTLTTAGTRRSVAAPPATDAAPRLAAPARDAAPRVAAANRDAAPRLAAPARDAAPRVAAANRDAAPRLAAPARDAAPRVAAANRDAAPRLAAPDRHAAQRLAAPDRDTALRVAAADASAGHAAPDRDAAPRLAAPDRDAAPRLAAPAHAAVPPARLFPRAARGPGVVLGLTSFGYGAVNAFAVLQAGAGALGVFAAAFLAVRLLGSRLVDDFGPRRVVVASAALEGVALGAVATGIVPLVPLALAGAALALVFPALAVSVVEAAPERERGAAVGAMTSCWDVGIAAAGPFGALLVSPGDLAPAFALAAGLAALAALGASASRDAVREGGGANNRPVRTVSRATPG